MQNSTEGADEGRSFFTEEEQAERRKEWLAILMDGFKRELEGEQTNTALANIFGVKPATISYLLAGKIDPENLEAKRWNKIIELTGRTYETLQAEMRRYAGMPVFFIDPENKIESNGSGVVRMYRTLPLNERAGIIPDLLRVIADTQTSMQIDDSLSIVGTAIDRAVKYLGEERSAEVSGLSVELLHTLSRIRIAPSELYCAAIVKLLKAHKSNSGWSIETIRQAYNYEREQSQESKDTKHNNKANGAGLGQD